MVLLRSATSEFLRVVGVIPEGTWDNDTPCGHLKVHEVVNHVVAGNRFAVRVLDGESAAEALLGLDGNLLGDDLIGATASSATAQEDAFGAIADLDRFTVRHPAGDVSGTRFLVMRSGDLTVHGWDLARGAGVPAHLDPSLVAGLWLYVEPYVAEMARSGAYGQGATGSVAREAPDLERLLDAFGRRP